MHNEAIQDLEVLLGHSFRDKRYLVNALSHSSIKTEQRPSNERLEFLGDSVLGLIVSDALYRRYPEDDEGTLTRIKSQAVSRSTLQRIAVAMGLDRHILVGKGVAKREIPASLLGNLFEALVGAIYLDAGLAAARKFILRHLDVIIGEIVQDRAERNYKSMLQHHCQREMGAVPTYRVLREAGPAHHRTFDVAVLVNGREFGRARGDSKKEAEQGSARAALIHFKAVQEPPQQPVRGAGTVLRVGPENGGRKSRRGGRGKGRAAKKAAKKKAQPATEAKPTPEKEPEEPKAAEKAPAGEGAKKTRRTRRRRKTTKAEAAGAAQAVPEPEEQAETAPEPEKTEPAAGEGEARRRRSSRRRSRRGRGKQGPASDAPST